MYIHRSELGISSNHWLVPPHWELMYMLVCTTINGKRTKWSVHAWEPRRWDWASAVLSGASTQLTSMYMSICLCTYMYMYLYVCTSAYVWYDFSPQIYLIPGMIQGKQKRYMYTTVPKVFWLFVNMHHWLWSCTCVQIIQEIEEHYFEEGDVDCSQHELEVSTLYDIHIVLLVWQWLLVSTCVSQSKS